MDIGGLNSYKDMIASAANQTAPKLESALKKDPSKATDEELMDACKQFEAYFLEQVFKEMMKTVPKNEDRSMSTTNMMDYYEDQMVQKIAEDSTEQNSFGLAQILYEQMCRNYGVEPKQE